MSRPYRFGLLGHKIDYSLSPQLFSAIFEILKVEGQFSVFDIPPNKLFSELNALRCLDGFSVTIPHKQVLTSYLDSQSPEASSIGAVNSIKVEDGRLSGHNTDYVGFLRPLATHDFSNKNILILGCGGAARAVLYGLLSKYDSARIVVAGRNLKNVSEMIKTISGSVSTTCETSEISMGNISGTGQFDLIVNCTPLGSLSQIDSSPLGVGGKEKFEFNSNPVCYDLIYNPPRTVFLKQAADAGCKIINGLPMLIYQALESFQFWSGDQFDNDQLYRRLFDRFDAERKV